MGLVSAALAIAFSSFYSISKAWQRGQAMSDSLNRGEFVMEQLVSGLRSAFYPIRQSASTASNTTSAVNTNAGATNAQSVVPSACNYGFSFKNAGDGARARDEISWVKTGKALLGPDDPLWRGLHRVQVRVEENKDGFLSVTTRAWRPYGNEIDFDPEEVEPFVISEKVLGMNCRVAKKMDQDEGWEWEEEWADDATNRLPLAVELSLYLEPPENRDEPMEIRRIVEIPVAPLTWSGDVTK